MVIYKFWNFNVDLKKINNFRKFRKPRHSQNYYYLFSNNPIWQENNFRKATKSVHVPPVCERPKKCFWSKSRFWVNFGWIFFRFTTYKNFKNFHLFICIFHLFFCRNVWPWKNSFVILHDIINKKQNNVKYRMFIFVTFSEKKMQHFKLHNKILRCRMFRTWRDFVQNLALWIIFFPIRKLLGITKLESIRVFSSIVVTPGKCNSQREFQCFSRIFFKNWMKNRKRS